VGVVLEVRKIAFFHSTIRDIVLVGEYFPKSPPIAVLLHGISDLKVIVISANK
jgi:hypothetical protein